MKKRLIYGALLTTLLLNLLVGVQVYYVQGAQDGAKDEPYSNLALLSRVLELIRQDYVDADKVGYQDLVYGALKGMVATLDPHSEFMDKRKFEELKKDTEGAFGGVGITVTVKDNVLTVVAPMEDTPGYKAGILAGDRIIRIDGKSTERMSLSDAVGKLRGKPGTKVSITIFRPSSSTTKDHELVRAEIKVGTVKDILGKTEFQLSDNNIGYIRMTQFGEHTASDLERALEKLEEQGMKGLVLDLRGNPGGLLDQAVAVCEKFLPRGQLIVSTEGRGENQKTEYTAKGLKPRSKEKLPMVILVNGGSASASEIVSGCLQDLKRAVILGEQTFGKGSVQSILPLNEGAALRLTTAKYYTPNHWVIHEKGIKPDILVPMSDEEERSLFLKRSPGGLESLDEAEREKVEKVRDAQLDRAFDMLKGITLFTNREKKDAEKVATAK